MPQGDWRTSLCVWVELCARRAELPALLKAADVLVTLPPKQKRQPDNRLDFIRVLLCFQINNIVENGSGNHFKVHF